MPPTPTFLPPGSAYVHIPSSYSLWQSAPYAIQSWNMAGEIAIVVQLIILIGLLIVVAILVTKALKAIRSGVDDVSSGLAESKKNTAPKRRKDAF